MSYEAIQSVSKQPPCQGTWTRHFLRLPNAPEDPSQPWFVAAPIGENKLGTMVKDMFAEVGIAGKTNYRP